MRKSLAGAIALVASAIALGCSEHTTAMLDPNTDGVATANGSRVISIGIKALALALGQEQQLGATVQGNANVSWATKDTSVATVSRQGLVAAKRPGITYVIATAKGVSDSAEVTVNGPPKVGSVLFAVDSSKLATGQTTRPVATVLDEKGAAITNFTGRTVQWASTNSLVAKVDTTGVVTALQAGVANVVYSVDAKADTMAVTVVPVPVSRVNVTLAATSLTAGGTTQATAGAVDANGNSLTGRLVAWSSSNAAVATVSSSGLVTAVGAGNASITANVEGAVGSAMIGVTAPAVASVATVTVALASATVTTGQTTQATATARDAQGNALTGRAVTWASSNAAVATVSAAGVVTAVAAGQANITATVESKSGAATLSATVSATSTPSEPTAPTAPTTSPSTGPAALPELPRLTVSRAMPAVTGRSITVSAGGDLQAALDAAVPGDEVVVQAGATFTGPFVLRKKTGTGWITVRTSGSLPAPGTRVTPASAAQMPKILAKGTDYAITTELGAHNWRLIGLEVTAPSTMTVTYNLVNLGDHSAQNTDANQPRDLVLDRMYIHGHPNLDFQRCVLLNAGATAIIDSWISECHGRAADSQAIMGWNGSGPYLIENNHLEGAGEVVMFGGADPAINGRLPRDITIRRNHFYKPREWNGVWACKNSFELKLGQRLLVENNVFENSFSALQDGTLIVLKTVNQGGTATWSETSDITFRSNVLKGGVAGFAMSGLPEYWKGGVPLHRVLIEQVIAVEMGERSWLPGAGKAVRLGTVADLTIRFSTFHSGGFSIGMEAQGSDRLTITDNVINGEIVSEGGKAWWETAQPYHAPEGVLRRNGLILPGYTAPAHNPLENRNVATLAAVGFVNLAGNDWRLSSLSPFAGIAADGRNPGADFDQVLRNVSGVAP